MGALEFVVLTLGAFLQTVHHGITTRYHRGRIQQECEERGTLVSLSKRTWTRRREYGTLCLLSCFDVDQIRGSLAPACSYEVNFNTEDGLG